MFGFDDRTRAILDGVRRTGSFSAAARGLGLDASNARRHVRLAEARASARLVEAWPGGRGLPNARLTAVGKRFVARRALLGRVLSFDDEQGVSVVRVGSRDVLVAGRHEEGPVELEIPAEAVSLERAPSGSARSPRNAWPMRVESLVEEDGVWRVRLVGGGLALESRVVRGALRDLRLRSGSRVIAVVKAVAIRVNRG